MSDSSYKPLSGWVQVALIVGGLAYAFVLLVLVGAVGMLLWGQEEPPSYPLEPGHLRLNVVAQFAFFVWVFFARWLFQQAAARSNSIINGIRDGYLLSCSWLEFAGLITL